MMIREAVCAVLALCVADLALTSGRYVNDMAVDQRDGVEDELSVGHELRALKGNFDLDVIKKSSSSLDHRILSREKRKAVKFLNLRWAQNEVPFEIDYSQFSNEDIYTIFQGMNEWQQYTCLKFRPRKTHDKNFVKFINGEGCYAALGMIGGEQPISLDKVGCVIKSTVIHEIGHAIGFFHEQSRPDRDRFVTVFPENIEERYIFAFNKSNDIDTYGVPYDYTSIMHYDQAAFSKNDKITIKTKDPNFQSAIGSFSGLSYYDINLANLMYKCGQKCHPRIKCPSYGFLGKDCTCWCRGDTIQMCDGSGHMLIRDPLPPTKELCFRLSKSCQSWKGTDECTDSKTYCPMYCNYCDILLKQY